MRRLIILMVLSGLPALAFASSSVRDTVHNLSTSGPGQLTSQTIDRVCVFCHTPHSGLPNRGLWNRSVPDTAITPYESPDVVGIPENLSGPSALCMSCHDGTIALGAMLQPPNRGRGIDLRNVFVTGRNRFESNLSNHHPIGLDYVAPPRLTGSRLVNPASLNLPLTNGEVHCTSCHDAHSDEHRPFLRTPSHNGTLCLGCHVFSGDEWDWSGSAHATSPATPRTGNPWPERRPEWAGANVAENACENCHVSHNAPSAIRLKVGDEERTCYRCHNGSVAEFNIQSEIQKFYRHPVDLPSGDDHERERIETTFSTPLHVECEDCHNPHAARAGAPMISFNPANPAAPLTSRAPEVSGSMVGVTGLDINGRPKEEATYEYEVCFKCHGVRGRSSCENDRCPTAVNLQMTRQDNEYNLREKFDSRNPSLVSYHPVHSNNPANDSEVPSLRLDIPLERQGSLIYCGDCHASSFSPSAGGTGASGPHGSRHPAILSQRYELDAGRFATVSSSALCSKCHSMSSLFADESFPHSLHVLENRKGCVTCHDPHGSTVYPHLINFLTNGGSGAQTLRITGAGFYSQPTWIDTGRYSGTCWLNCHGVVHEEFSYESGAAIPVATEE